jgi:hypothetical protein
MARIELTVEACKWLQDHRNAYHLYPDKLYRFEPGSENLTALIPLFGSKCARTIKPMSLDSILSNIEKGSRSFTQFVRRVIGTVDIAKLSADPTVPDRLLDAFRQFYPELFYIDMEID